MDVIDFLCVSLRSRTVKLLVSLASGRAVTCSGAGFSSQNDDHTQSKSSVLLCFFVCAQGLNAKNIHKIFLVYVGNFCHIKPFTTERDILPVTFGTSRLCLSRLPCWDWDRRNCAVSGRIDWSWQENNDRQCTNCTRTLSWLNIQDNA
jgi:hypothetical protein